MPRSRAADLAALVRLPNVVLAAAGVAVGAILVLGRVVVPHAVALAMASAACLAAAGNVANDVYDIDIDRVNRPDRPLPAGGVSPSAAIAVGGIAGGGGLLLAWLIGGDVLTIAAVALPLMLVYSPLLKPRGLLGNLTIAIIAALPLIYGAAAAGYWPAGVVPWALAALLHLAREVVKDLEDAPGDRLAGRRTVPIVWGERAAYVVAAATLILFIPAALAPWFARWYGNRYGILATLTAVGAAALVVQLLHRRVTGVRASLKSLMVLGLAALLWDRL